ncbi:MAG: rane protein [Frankiales bacterium]|nr:rane protein [Frankiales bacterium]
MLAVVLCLVWSSAFIFIKLALRDASAMDFGALRVLAATPLLLLALWLRDAVALRAALRDRRVHSTGLVLGAVSIAGFIGLQTAGFELAGIGFGAVLIYAQPMLVAVLARFVLGERLRPRQLLGLVTGWVGVALAVLGEVAGGHSGDGVWTAAALFLGGAVCFAVSTIVVKAISSGPRPVPLPPALLLAFAYGSVPLVLLGLGDGESVDWTWRLVACIAYTGVVSLAGGYLLQFRLLERGGASVVSSYIFAVPVLTAAYGVALFGEALTAGLVLGAAAVAAGILLVTVPARPRLLEESP